MKKLIVLTLKFKQEIYDEWTKRPVPSTVRKFLEANGFDTHKLGINFYKNIALAFQRSGRPSHSKSPLYNAEGVKYGKSCEESSKSVGIATNEKDKTGEQLIESGRFIRSVSNIWFSPDFEKELHDD